VKVSATIAAGVPDRTILVQGPNCQSRTGQGKSGLPTDKRTAVPEPRFVPSQGFEKNEAGNFENIFAGAKTVFA
jgi:hypothetical protein